MNCPKCNTAWDEHPHDPLVLPCGHSICGMCMAGREPPKCPLDGRQARCFGDLPRNLLALELVKMLGTPPEAKVVEKPPTVAISEGAQRVLDACASCLYENGCGIAQWKEFVQIAHAINTPAAWYGIGWAHDGKMIRPSDRNEAIRMYRKAAEAGHAAAQYELGLKLARDGHEEEALLMYEQSASQGYARGMYRCGICYLQGRGCERSEQVGIAYLAAAAHAGYEIAIRELANRGDV